MIKKKVSFVDIDINKDTSPCNSVATSNRKNTNEQHNSSEKHYFSLVRTDKELPTKTPNKKIQY